MPWLTFPWEAEKLYSTFSESIRLGEIKCDHRCKFAHCTLFYNHVLTHRYGSPLNVHITSHTLHLMLHHTKYKIHHGVMLRHLNIWLASVACTYTVHKWTCQCKQTYINCVKVHCRCSTFLSTESYVGIRLCSGWKGNEKGQAHKDIDLLKPRPTVMLWWLIISRLHDVAKMHATDLFKISEVKA